MPVLGILYGTWAVVCYVGLLYCSAVLILNLMRWLLLLMWMNV